MAANSTCPRETERCRHHHSSDEWERQKPLIMKYYIDQGNFIERTMSIMRKRHNFVARYLSPPTCTCARPNEERDSRRMYMKMLNTWNLGKYLRSNSKKRQSADPRHQSRTEHHGHDDHTQT